MQHLKTQLNRIGSNNINRVVNEYNRGNLKQWLRVATISNQTCDGCNNLYKYHNSTPYKCVGNISTCNSYKAYLPICEITDSLVRFMKIKVHNSI